MESGSNLLLLRFFFASAGFSFFFFFFFFFSARELKAPNPNRQLLDDLLLIRTRTRFGLLSSCDHLIKMDLLLLDLWQLRAGLAAERFRNAVERLATDRLSITRTSAGRRQNRPPTQLWPAHPVRLIEAPERHSDRRPTGTGWIWEAARINQSSWLVANFRGLESIPVFRGHLSPSERSLGFTVLITIIIIMSSLARSLYMLKGNLAN